MVVYYVNLLLILGLGWPLCVHKPAKSKTALYLLITFGYMWFLATFRYGIGYDYFSYEAIFQTIADPSLDLYPMERMEPGFVLLTKLMTAFVSSTTVMYGVYGLLIYGPVAWFIYKYSKAPWMSAWLYVTLAFFYCTMNFIRQNLACSVLLLGYGLLKNNIGLKIPLPKGRSYLLSSYLLVALLAATFHKTALIMIPVILVCNLSFNKYTAAFYGLGGILLFLSSNFILDIVTTFIYKEYRGSIYLEHGLSTIFLVIPFILFATCLCMYPYWKKRDPAATHLLNLMMYSAIIWLFITKHFVIERFSLTIYIFALLAVPAALECLKCTPEEYRQLEEMKASDKGKKGKEAIGRMKKLAQKVSDHEKYYWSAVVAVLFVTFLYNEFGAWVDKFHNVFPYQSVLPFLQ